MTHPSIRKVHQGVADRRQMLRLFDRHAQRPNRFDGDATPLYAGEWFEIDQSSHDYMFEILPPLWVRGSMFALREFLIGAVTSVFFALRIDGQIRYFHGYCDLSDQASVEQLRMAIIARESQPVRAMTREERVEHIWSTTSEDYRGYAGEGWPHADRGKRTITLYSIDRGTTLKRLDRLSDDEIAAKLPVHLRHLPSIAAA